jgi:hypothetical protein
VEAEDRDRAETSHRERIQPGAPARRKEAAMPHEDLDDRDGEEDERPRPQRKKSKRKARKSSPVWLWVAGGAGVLVVLLACGIGLFFFLRSGRPPRIGETAQGGTFVPADQAGFVTVRVADLWATDAVKRSLAALPPDARNQFEETTKEIGVAPADVERVTLVLIDGVPSVEVGWVVATTVNPYDKAKLLAKLKNPREATHQGKTYHVTGDEGPAPGARAGRPGGAEPSRDALYFHDARTLVVGPESGVKKALESAARPVSPGHLTDALALAAGNDHVVAAFRLPDRTIQDMRTQFGQNPEMKKYEALLDFQTIQVTFHVAATVDTKISLKFADEAKAKSAKAAADAGIAALQKMLADLKQQMPAGFPAPKGIQEGFAQAEKLLPTLHPEQAGNSVSLLFRQDANEVVKGVESMAPLLKGMGAASGNAVSSNNIKQLILACHNHGLAEGSMPPAATYSKAGKPLLSWRVHLLPYIEQGELYRRFHLDEPWDSPHNSTLLPLMPKTFQTPGTGPGHTHYQVVVGPGTLFPNAPVAGMSTKAQLSRGPKIPQSFPDGTSNTLLIVEASRAVPWTKPEDVTFSPQVKMISRFGLPGSDSFHAGMADGSVLRIAKTVSETSLKAAILPADGQIPGPDWAPKR